MPAVALHADAFARLAESVARVNGVPNARRAYVPTPVLDQPADVIQGYIEGDDPVAGRPLMDVVLESLTRPVSADDLRGVEFDRSTPRLLEPDTEENLHRRFRENRWTDFLPIVLPTEERVEAMLAGTSHARDEIVGRLRPTTYRELWEFDVEKVAVNAVMAGAEPQHLPVILALASSGFTARQSSTSSMGAVVVVNGPIRFELDMNRGLGALGPYNHANAVIGRAYGLLSQNLQGGSVPGVTYMGCQGNTYAYNSVTFAENEENSPWEPYHVSNGHAPGDSTVSVFFCWGNSWSEGLRDTWREKLQATFAGQDPFMGSLLLLDPIVAQELVDLGFATKADLIAWIHDNVKIPAREYWDSYTAKTFAREEADLGVEPYATYAKAGPDDLIPVFEPERLNIVVVGGSSNGQWGSFNGRPLDPRFRNDPNDPHVVSIDRWR